MRPRELIFSLVAVLLLSSCASEDRLYPSQGLTAATAATVKGSSNSQGFKGEIYVAGVDGRLGPRSARGPLLVPPGSHVLDVVFEYGLTLANGRIAGDLRPGTVYVARADKTGVCDVMVWLEVEGSGEKISEKQLVKLLPAVNLARVVC